MQCLLFFFYETVLWGIKGLFHKDWIRHTVFVIAVGVKAYYTCQQRSLQTEPKPYVLFLPHWPGWCGCHGWCSDTPPNFGVFFLKKTLLPLPATAGTSRVPVQGNTEKLAVPAQPTRTCCMWIYILNFLSYLFYFWKVATTSIHSSHATSSPQS